MYRNLLLSVVLLASSARAETFNWQGATITGALVTAASGFTITGSTLPTLAGIGKTKTTVDQVFYSSAAAPVNLGSDITGLSFALAKNTSYYFEYDINHTSTATATGVWFGMTFPAGSTITWTVSQAIGLASYTISMSRGAEFATAAGATVDAADSACPAKLYGTISTLGAGTLQPRVKSELQNGRGSIKAGSSGRIVEQ